MKKDNSKPMTPEHTAELKALAALPEDQIDTRDFPEQRDWSAARRGLFFRPVKKQLTLRLDADLIVWFKSHAHKGEGYQTSINSALREYVAHHEQGRRQRLRRAAFSPWSGANMSSNPNGVSCST